MSRVAVSFASTSTPPLPTSIAAVRGETSVGVVSIDARTVLCILLVAYATATAAEPATTRCRP